MPFSFFRRQEDDPATPMSEQDVVRAGDDFARKEKLVERFAFLPPEMKKAAKDTALSRFLELLSRHMRS